MFPQSVHFVRKYRLRKHTDAVRSVNNVFIWIIQWHNTRVSNIVVVSTEQCKCICELWVDTWSEYFVWKLWKQSKNHPKFVECSLTLFVRVSGCASHLDVSRSALQPKFVTRVIHSSRLHFTIWQICFCGLVQLVVVVVERSLWDPMMSTGMECELMCLVVLHSI